MEKVVGEVFGEVLGDVPKVFAFCFWVKARGFRFRKLVRGGWLSLVFCFDGSRNSLIQQQYLPPSELH